ncbi:MAG TPA: hypothetical protein VI122_06870 [Thermoleophilaceae bacterium]
MQDLEDVQNQLETEMLYGQGVTNLITNLKKPLGLSDTATQANILSIAQGVEANISPPDSRASADPGAPLTDILYLGSSLVPVGGEALGAAA